MEWIIDRIEEDIAVVEISAGNMLDIPLSALPEGVSEGDVITLDINREAKELRQERINDLMDSLFAD
jgi:hypothetical protein